MRALLAEEEVDVDAVAALVATLDADATAAQAAAESAAADLGATKDQYLRLQADFGASSRHGAQGIHVAAECTLQSVWEPFF